GRFQFSIRQMLATTAIIAAAAWVYISPVGVLLGRETFYSPGYSSIGWLRVRIGMTERQVTDLLGEPLRTFDRGTNNEHWEYTSCGPSECYYLRMLYFNNGIVRDKRSHFHFD